MAAGQQPTLSGINGQLSACAVQLRDLCNTITDLNLQVGKLGTSGLQGIGASPTDATDIVNKWATINTVAAVYFGTATQGTAFNFNDALAPVRAGQ
jgi:hypothetical protein